MSRRPPRAATVLGAVALGAVVLTACAAGPAGEPAAAAPCADLPPADPAVSLPADLPTPSGQVLYEQASQGSTRVVSGRVDGTDFVAVRDELAGALEAAGYTLQGTDQEAVEAEVHFVQPVDGTVRVSQLCDGVLQIRYRLSPP